MSQKCQGLKSILVDNLCYNPSSLPCTGTAKAVVSDKNYNIGYCIPSKQVCPVGFDSGFIEAAREEIACIVPELCQAAKAGQYCHIKENAVNSLPCQSGEITFTVTNDHRQTIKVCSEYEKET